MMRLKDWKRLLILFAALPAAWVLTTANVFAQEAETGGVAVARKIDEFGRAGGCDHSARLDNFAIEIMNNPEATGLVITYGPAGKGSGTAEYRLEVTKGYLVSSRGIDGTRIKTINGGRYGVRGESFAEFWLVPPGADEPVAVKYESDAATFNGMFAEGPRWDGRYLAEDGGTGPPVGNSGMTGLADSLRLQPKTVAYVVAFNGEDSAPGAWRRVAEDDAETLRGYGVEDNRIKIIFGGHAKEAKAQLWILPSDAPPPVVGAERERRPSKAVQIGVYPQYQLKHEDDARWVFKAFADVLKADDKMNAVIVVRLPFVGSVESSEDAEVAVEEVPQVAEEVTAEPEDKEPPDINLVELVEKWKAALKKEYGIGDERLVVMFVPARDEYNEDVLEAWVVPQGVAMPDPFAIEDEEAPEDNEEETKPEKAGTKEQ